MFARYTSAISAGTGMTLGLLYVMQSLISLQPGVRVETRPVTFVPWTRLIVEEAPKTVDERPDIRDLTKTVPPPTRPDYATETGTIGVPTVEPEVPANPGGPVLGVYSDGPLVALIKVRPNYPAMAAARGLEGTVTVEFDVTAEGVVVNVRVIETSSSIFNRAAIQAAERFKFKPRVVDGRPQAAFGLQNLFRFEMEDEI